MKHVAWWVGLGMAVALVPGTSRADLVAHVRATSVNGGCAVDDHEGFGQGDPDRTLRMAIFDNTSSTVLNACATDCPSDDGNPATADGKTLDYCSQNSGCGSFDFPDQLLEKVIPDNSGAYFYFGLWDMDLDANDCLGDHFYFANTRQVLSAVSNNNTAPYKSDAPIAGMCWGFSDGGDVEGGGNAGNYTLNQVSWFTDSTGPSTPLVNATDDAITNPAWDNDATITVNVSGASDPNSGISDYTVTVRNTGTGATLVNQQSVGTGSTITICSGGACDVNLSLAHNTSYGVTVRAYNGASPTLTLENGADARSSAASAERVVAVDLNDPVSSVTAPAAGTWVNGDFATSMSDSDSGAGLQSCAYSVIANGTFRVTNTGRTCNNGPTVTVGSSANCNVQGASICVVQASSVDQARRNSVVGSRTFSVDWTPDNIATLTAATVSGGAALSAGGWTQDRDPFFAWTVTGAIAPISGYSWLVDGTPGCTPNTAGGNSGNVQLSTGALSDGAHTFSVRAVDAAGNCGPVSSFAVNVDGTAEALGPLTMRGGPGGAVVAPSTWQTDDTIYVEWTAPSSAAPVFGYSYAVNGTADCMADVLTNALDLSATPLGNGVTTLQVRTIDAAGNCGAASTTQLWADNAAETVSNILVRSAAGQPVIPLGQWTTGASPYVEWSVSSSVSPVVGYSWSTSGAPDCVVDVAVSNVTLPALPDGTTTFQVRAVDAAGNCGAVLTRAIQVDAQAETITGLAAHEFQNGPIIPANTWQPLNRPFWAWNVPSSSSPLTGYSIAVDGAADCVVDTALPRANPPAVADGIHTFEVRAVDDAGNCGPAASYTVWVDATGDDITGLTAFTDLNGAVIPPATWTSDNTPYVTWSASSVSPIAGYSVAVAGTVDCTPDTAIPSLAVSALPDGFHKVTVRAVDSAGNCGAAVSYDIYVDRTADPLTDLRLQDAVSGSQIPSAVWQSTDNAVVVFQAASASPLTGYSFGVDVAADCTVDTTATTVALGVLPQGMHRVEVRALDTAGNCGPAGSVELWIDTVAEAVGPVTALSNPGGTQLPSLAWQLDDTPTFVWGGVSSVAPVQYSYAVDNAADCTAETAATQVDLTLPPGQHVFHVRAVDAAGNCGAEQAFALWVDGDTDMDNIGAQADNCPAVFNPDQLNTDGDSQGDACDPDDDGDTILDARELVLNLNPLNRDTDGDTIPDNVEVVDPNNPRDTNADQTIDALDDDSDGDGLSDATEAGDVDLDTPPVDLNLNNVLDYRDALSDADGDGVTDAEEVGDTLLNTPPVNTDNNGPPDYLDTDSDDDGVLDGVDNCRTVSNPDQASTTDGGPGTACAPPVPDAGTSTPDASMTGSDGGGAGDAGTTTADGGAEVPDGGGTTSDGGTSNQDASTSTDDAGSTTLDGAVAMMDGSTMEDAGSTQQDGGASDGGSTGNDASRITRDGSVTGVPPGEEPGEEPGGCGCRASDTGVAPAVLWAAALLLWRRRRERAC